MGKARHLTKSRFKVGCECPTKLYYSNDSKYGNNNQDNPFLKSLAEGGFQVGELAKLYFSGGYEIETLDYEEALKQTEEYLKEENVIIYEAALKFENLFVRVDILKKTKNEVELIEVKAKSIDPAEIQFFKKRTLELDSEWEPYILDVAFQTYVAKRAHPELIFSPSLMLANKTATATVHGLNQNFMLESHEGRVRATVNASLSPEKLGKPILEQVSVDDEVDFVFKSFQRNGLNFLALVEQLSLLCSTGERGPALISSACKSCEYRINEKLKEKGFKSGFEECWKKELKLSDEDLAKPFAFEIWDMRKTDAFLDEQIVFMDQVKEHDLASKSASKITEGLSRNERQWLQVRKTTSNDKSSYIDFDGLSRAFARYKYPLNFIDFETTMVAIPFNKGRRPYEQIAFQFSHHTISETGDIKHSTEYINRVRGQFPNFEFVRALKKALEQNSGTVFRYAAHENTVLCQIHDQLSDSSESDRVELCKFIETITSNKDGSWEGERNMIDMCDLVKKFYYNPRMKGSNSIKQVLPAVLNESKLLQSKYSEPIYGPEFGSKNYKDWIWIKFDESGNVKDPYKLLPPIFTDLDLEQMDSLIKDNSLADGGAAMTSYARMQFTEMSDLEASKVAQALLKYCELDTMAMVMIHEHWAEELRNYRKQAA